MDQRRLNGLNAAKRARRLLVSAVSSLLALSTSHAQTTVSPAPPTPLGQLVDLGGYKLHVFCTGTGGPTVVLSPGSGDFSFDWTLVQPGIAKFTRVCSYDRAGEAWSDLGPKPRTMTQEAFDLRRALIKAGVAGPYILVGHSIGGMVVRTFAADYPSDLAGMVLIDGSHEEDTMMINGKVVTAVSLSQGRRVPAPRTSATVADGLDAEEIKKIEAMIQHDDFMRPHIEAPYNKLPADIQRLQLWATAQPKHWEATNGDFWGEETKRLYKIDHASRHPLGRIPLIVLSQDMSKRTDEHAKIHDRNQQAMARYSARGKLIVVRGAGHHIQLEQPEVVVGAIRQVLAPR